VARAWNIFSISREPRNEDQLTEMVAWLANAVPAVRRALLQLAFAESLDEREVEITTQHGIARGRLDAFLSSESVALVIESKLGSGYGDGQLGKYLTWLDREFADRQYRGLLTLTADEDPWPELDVEFADARGIRAQARLWEELHEALAPAIGDEDLPAQLVGQFLEMLTSEKLVPMQPLAGNELQTAWSESWRVISRYRDFFRACKDAIAEALDGSPASKSDRGDEFWQDYALRRADAHLVVGLYFSDEHEKAPGYVCSGAPIVWMAAKVFGEGQQEAHKKLNADPPSGWYPEPTWWRERPYVWCPLPPILDEASTFDEQREALAAAVAVGRGWVESAITTEALPGVPEPQP
jgi:hypothetical protein